MSATNRPTTQPLGKPPGSVRAYLALGILAAFLITHALAAAWLLRVENIEAAVGLLSVLALEAGTVTGFYFGSRSTWSGEPSADVGA
ncbi:MAG: hypothetical protein OXC56_07665 [Chloroflexi bacterium]|nr:hypothetical protein [Chloroflexota bacterium]